MPGSRNVKGEREWDAIVVGGGISGLTTAAYLATNGMRTLLLEQQAILGGCAQTFRRKPYEFNVGLHYLLDCGPGGILPTILRGVDGFDTFVLPSGNVRIPVGWEAFTARMVERFPADHQAIRGCLGTLRVIGEKAASLYAPTAAHPGLDALRTPAATLRLLRGGFTSTKSFLDSYELNREFKSILSTYAALPAAQPSDFPVAGLAFALEHALKSGSWYPSGGGQAIAAHLADVVQSHGSEVRTEAAVEQILVSGGRVRGVRINSGEEFVAPVVVSSGDIRQTYLRLVGTEHLRRRSVRRANSWRMASPTVTMNIGVDIDLADVVAKTTYWVLPNYTLAWPSEGVPDRMPMGIASSPAAKDPEGRFGGPNHSTLELIMWPQLPNDSLWAPWLSGAYRKDEKYLRLKQQIEASAIAEAIRTIPQIEGHIAWREASTPLTQLRYTSAMGWGGVALATDQMLTRPRGATTEIDGLYLTGQSLPYGPGVVGVARGAVATASAILERDFWQQIHRGQVFGDPSLLSPVSDAWDPYFASKRHALKRGAARRGTAPSSAGIPI
jgi:phytoene dehydrogenase-like protein